MSILKSSLLSPKQQETVETILKLTDEHGYPPTLDEIASSMGITKGTLQYHMTALRKKQVIDWTTGAARSVKVIHPDFNSSASSSKAKPANQEEFEVESTKTRIPILGKIAAGVPLDVHNDTDDFLELDSYFPHGCYALKVKGESMVDALISDGDLVLIEPRQTARNGEIVVALLEEEAATLKRFYKEDDGSIRLQPENPTMEPIMLPSNTNLKLQGIVKGVIRKV